MSKYKGIDAEIAKAAGLIDPAAANRKEKKITYAEYLLRQAEDQIRLQKIRDANLEAFVRQQTALGLPVPPPMTPEQVEQLEAKIGRKLSDAEKMLGTLGREDTPDLNDVFRPVPKQSTVSLYDAEIAEAEAAVESERVAKMSEAQRTLYAMQQAKADHVRKQQSAAAMAEHLKQHKDKIEWLENVRRDAAVNPQWTNEQLAVVDNALAQLKYGPDGDQNVADKLHGEVTVIMFRHIQEQKEDVANKLRAAGVLTDSEIEAAVAARFPDANAETSSATSSDSDPEWWALSDKSMALRDAFNALQSDPKADPAAVKQARADWFAASEVTAASKAKYEAAQAGATTEG